MFNAAIRKFELFRYSALLSKLKFLALIISWSGKNDANDFFHGYVLLEVGMAEKKELFCKCFILPLSLISFLFLAGSVYPFLLAIPLNSALAVKYGTMEIPLFSTKPSAYQDMFSFWSRKMRYFKSQFITIAIFQTLLFSFVADRQFTVVHKELDTQFVRESRWWKVFGSSCDID